MKVILTRKDGSPYTIELQHTCAVDAIITTDNRLCWRIKLGDGRYGHYPVADYHCDIELEED